MFIRYLTYYLVFVAVVSLLVGLFVLRLKASWLKTFLLVMLAIIIFPAPAGYFYITYFSNAPEVVVPDLTGLRLEIAQNQLQDLGLRSSHGASVNDDRYPEGIIAASQPEAGQLVKLGRTVTLIVSSGKRKVMVPNLLGRTLAEAETIILAQELLLGSLTYEANAQADSGAIIAQEPLPQDEVEIGREVNLVIAQ